KVRATVVLPTPPLSAPIRMTAGLAMAHSECEIRTGLDPVHTRPLCRCKPVCEGNINLAHRHQAVNDISIEVRTAQRGFPPAVPLRDRQQVAELLVSQGTNKIREMER